MTLTKHEFFQYDYVRVTNEDIFFVKDNITGLEQFKIKSEGIESTLKFIEQAVEEGWIQLVHSNPKKMILIYEIIKGDLLVVLI